MKHATSKVTIHLQSLIRAFESLADWTSAVFVLRKLAREASLFTMFSFLINWDLL